MCFNRKKNMLGEGMEMKQNNDSSSSIFHLQENKCETLFNGENRENENIVVSC